MSKGKKGRQRDGEAKRETEGERQRECEIGDYGAPVMGLSI